jgi:TolA-binding protein
VPKSRKKTTLRKTASAAKPAPAPQTALPAAGPEAASEITLHASRRFWLFTLGGLMLVLGLVQGYGYLTGWGSPERLAQRHFNAAQQLTLAKRYDAAIRQYEKILALKTTDDNLRQAMIGMADLLRDKGQGDRAIALYTRLRQQDPNNVVAAWAGLQIADILVDANRLDEAARAYQDVGRHFPRSDWDAEARLGLGRVLEKREQLHPAIAAYAALIKDYNGGFLAAEAWVRTGKCYELLGDARSAERAYRTVLDKYPSSTWDEAKAQLERLQHGQGAEGVRMWGAGK